MSTLDETGFAEIGTRLQPVQATLVAKLEEVTAATLPTSAHLAITGALFDAAALGARIMRRQDEAELAGEVDALADAIVQAFQRAKEQLP